MAKPKQDHEPQSVRWYANEIAVCRVELRKAEEVERSAKSRRKRVEADLGLALSGLEFALAEEQEAEDG